MRRFRFLSALLLTVALLAAGCAGAQQTTTEPTTDTPATAEESTTPNPDEEPSGGPIEVSQFDLDEITYPALSDFTIPQPRRIELSNGLTVFLLEDHTLPQVSASARIGAGEVWAPDSTAGLASITGTVMRTGGTAEMTPDEVNQALENVGATVETGIGSTSGSAYMNTLAEHVDTVLPIFQRVLTQPAFAEEKVALAKRQQKTQISRRNENPQQIAFREMQKLIYGEDSPYARVPQYYTIDRIQRQDLVSFHDRWVHPNNTILSVWGDFDAAQMEQKIREAFGGWERAEGFERPQMPTVEGKRDYSVHFIPKSDVTQSTVLMGHPGAIKKSNSDYYPVIIMNEVLSGGFTSRLFQSVRTEQGLAYAVFGSYVAPYDREGLFQAGVFSKSASTVEAANAVLEQIRRMRTEAPSEEELQLAKDSYLNSFVFNFDTRREILGRLMTYEYYGYPADFLQQVKNGVQQVSAQGVQRVAQKYLHPDQVDVLVLGNENDFSQPVAALAQGGAVEEIDISIPTEPPGEGQEAEPAASAEQQAAGQQLLAEVRAAMGGDAYDDLENMRQSAETVAQTPQGEQTIEQMLATDLSGQVHAKVTLPNGLTLTVIDDGEQAFIQTPQGTQPAPPRVRRQFLSGLQRDLTYLMARAGELETSDQGTETVEGAEYRALRITPPGDSDAFTLLVNPETMMPARMRFQQMTRQGPVETTAVFSDFREVSGVMVPHKTTGYQNGEQASTTTVTNFETNVDFPSGYFSVE